MMPVFSIYRSGNLTEDQANKLFSPLKTAFSVSSALFYLGIIVGIVGCVVGVHGFTKLQELKNKKKESLQDSSYLRNRTKLKVSLQKMEAQKKMEDEPEKPHMVRVQDDEEEMRLDEEMEREEVPKAESRE